MLDASVVVVRAGGKTEGWPTSETPERNPTMTDQPTLVLGGTGKTGRRVVTRLTRRNLPVRVGSRTAGVPFDWQRPDTWAAALDGVGAVYMS